jgi:hypothetical protein
LFVDAVVQRQSLAGLTRIYGEEKRKENEDKAGGRVKYTAGRSGCLKITRRR